jgi:hypothetical protein
MVQDYAEWNHLAQKIAFGCWAVGLLVVLGHLLKLSMTKESKDKYDYINRHEIKLLLIGAVIMVIGFAFYFNSWVTAETGTLLWIVVRLFTTISMGLLTAMIMQNLLKFYYPFYIEKRLKVLRYKPRISPKTGKPMKLLSEEEEDSYLDEGMIAEENLFSMDYDVWKDEESGYIKIEKYAGHLHAVQCPECNYQTFKVVKEEILKAPSEIEEGELMKHYLCGYCGYKAKKAVTLKVSTKFEGAAATA